MICLSPPPPPAAFNYQPFSHTPTSNESLISKTEHALLDIFAQATNSA